jgi:hypothetical protein
VLIGYFVEKYPMKITFLYAFLTIISFTAFSQEDSVTNRRFLKNIIKESIPDDIMKDGHILVIQNPYYGLRGDKKNDKENEKIKSLLDSIYKGQYLLVTQSTALDVLKNTKVYKYRLTMDPTDIKGGPVRFLIEDYSILMDINEKKSWEKAIKYTGISSYVLRNYLDQLKLLIFYINQKG